MDYFKNIANEIKKNYQKKEIVNIWLNSTNEWIKQESNPQKGKIGEDIINIYLEKNNYKIYNRINCESDTTYIDNNILKSVEIKTSCLNKTGYFKWLQIRMEDNFDEIFLISIYPNDIKIYKLSKDYLLQLINKNIIKKQHGGERTHYEIYYLGIKSNRIPEWLEELEIKNDL